VQHETDSIDDKTLLQKAQKNEMDALQSIHHRYFKSLYNYALYRVNDPMTAEDITSEVFARLLKVIQGSAKQPRSLRRWLFGVAHNIVVDYLRQKYRTLTVDLTEEQLLLSNEEDSPVAALENNLKIMDLRNALAKLPEVQKEVIALRFGADIPVKFTAQIMGKSVSAVKVLQFRAVKALKEQLDGWVS
jgi:RNA polymerase sigma-70 factor (ECF subfamily)